MRSFAFSLSLAIAAHVNAGGERIPVGARSAGLAHANLTLIDLWCSHANQAGLAGLEHPMAGIFYQQHWLSPDLAMQGLVFALPLGNGTIAASGNNFGFDLYREQQFGVAYAMRFGEGLRAGVQLDYLNVQLGDDYGSSNTMVAEVGVQARLTDALWVGAHFYNPTQTELGGPYAEKVPTVMRAGLGYTFSDKLLMTGAVEKDIDKPETFRAGIEYHPGNALFFRTGVSTGPVQGHFGLGLRFGRVDLDMAVSVRSQLGMTPQVNLNYRFE